MKIYWIFGSSASGKERLINFLMQNPNGELAQRLGFDQESILVIKSSIDNISQFDDDPVVEKRELIIDEIMSHSNNICLVKGQDIDLEEGRITKLQDLAPGLYHYIIFLHTDIDMLYQRVQLKKRWTGEDSKQDFISRLHYQIELLQKLRGIPIIALESSNDEYTSMIFPPIL